MPRYEIFESHDPRRTPIAIVEAATPLTALDAYSEEQGFAPYSALSEEEAASVGLFFDATLAGAIMGNTEIMAVREV